MLCGRCAGTLTIRLAPACLAPVSAGSGLLGSGFGWLLARVVPGFAWFPVRLPVLLCFAVHQPVLDPPPERLFGRLRRSLLGVERADSRWLQRRPAQRLHPIALFAPEAGAVVVVGRSGLHPEGVVAPGAGVVGPEIRPPGPRYGCKPPQRVQTRPRNGRFGPPYGCRPPQRVQTWIGTGRSTLRLAAGSRLRPRTRLALGRISAAEARRVSPHAQYRPCSLLIPRAAGQPARARRGPSPSSHRASPALSGARRLGPATASATAPARKSRAGPPASPQDAVEATRKRFNRPAQRLAIA